MIRSRVLAVAALAASLPLAATAPAEATTVPCSGTYATAGVASQQCTFVYLGGSVTASISITGPAGHKYVTIGIYPGGQYCEREVLNGTGTSCSFTVTPNVAVGTLMTCSSAAVGRPAGTVTYSCK
jgi:hypothetical protein